MAGRSTLPRSAGAIVTGVLVLLVLYLTSLHSYLLFHSIVELFTIIVAAGVFVIAWNARRFLDNNYLLFIGIASLFVGLLDLMHTLAYRGMGVFRDETGNLATQLWVASRYLQALSLIVAPWFLRRRLSIRLQLITYAGIAGAIVLSIFYWRVFPAAYVAGSGLTTFKKVSEILVSLLLLAATGWLAQHRREFEPSVWKLLGVYLLLTVVSELAFTSYVSVYGGMNLFGHFVRLLAFWALYRAIIVTGLEKPYAILLRSVQTSQVQLREYAEALESRNEELRLSEEKLLEEAEALQGRNEELDAFAHTVAHDLKAPLSVIVGASALVRDAADLPRATAADLLQRVERTALEMNDIVDGLLLLSQVRKVEAPRAPVDMPAVVDKVLRRHAEMIRDRGAILTLPEAWPEALGYGPWLEEVWSNYLTNALKYGGTPPRIELGADVQPDGQVRFWMRDHGAGVPAEEQDRLFLPFGEFARARKAGHGLGLSIVRQIVEKLGGGVGLEHGAVEGSVFYFTLPVAVRPEAAELVPAGG